MSWVSHNKYVKLSSNKENFFKGFYSVRTWSEAATKNELRVHILIISCQDKKVA